MSSGRLGPARRLLITAALLLPAPTATAQWLVPPTPANRVSVTIVPTVTFDAASGRYTYDYAIASSTASVQNVGTFALQLMGPVAVAASPAGWTFGKYQHEPIVEWSATEAAPLAPGQVDDGGLPPAAHPVRPGTRKSGFRLTSPDPPGEVPYYVQGEVPLPVLAPGVDADSLPLPDDHITVDSVKGITLGPVPVKKPPPAPRP